MHFSIDRTVHTTAFDKPVVDHWLERKIAQTAAGSLSLRNTTTTKMPSNDIFFELTDSDLTPAQKVYFSQSTVQLLQKSGLNRSKQIYIITKLIQVMQVLFDSPSID